MFLEYLLLAALDKDVGASDKNDTESDTRYKFKHKHKQTKLKIRYM